MEFKTLILMNVASIISVIIAGILAHKKINGWGWFLFVALLLVTNPN